MPWSDPTIEEFRADLVALIIKYRDQLGALALFNAAGDILARLAIPDAPMPDPTPPAPEAPAA